MKGLSLLWSAVLISFAMPVQAADIIGNGGDVVVCEDGKIEMLDLFEGRVLRGHLFDYELLGANEFDTVKNILQRLKRLDPHRALKYQALADSFMSEAWFVGEATLVDVSDSDESIRPMNCEIKQLAIQRTPRFPKDKRYFIDHQLWIQMEDRDQASLILHELIYREALTRGHLNSVRVRYFNSLISSFDFVDVQDFGRILRIMDFPQSFELNSGGKTYVFNSKEPAEPACPRPHLKMAKFKDDQEIAGLYPDLKEILKTRFAERKDGFRAEFYRSSDLRFSEAAFSLKGVSIRPESKFAQKPEFAICEYR